MSIPLTPLRYTRSFNTDWSQTHIFYGGQMYTTANEHFYLSAEREDVTVYGLPRIAGSWYITPITRFENEYPLAYGRYLQEGLHNVPFRRRRDALDAIKAFLYAEGIEWQ